MTTHATVFADAISEAHVANGVARIALVAAGSDGKPVPAGMLVVPLTRLPAVANSLVGLLQQIEAKVKEAQAAQATASAAPAVAPATTDGAGTSSFRFGN